MERSRIVVRRLLLLALLLGLAACGSSVGQEPESDPAGAVTPLPYSTADDAPTPEANLPVSPPATVSPVPSPAELESDAGGGDGPPAAYLPAETLAAAAQVRAGDWVKGATDEPLIIIVEYGDFQ